MISFTLETIQYTKAINFHVSVDEEVSFHFNTFQSKTEPIEVVDAEGSFNYNNQRLKQSQYFQHQFVDWLSTMVIIYQDLLLLDIKKEPKEDYEEHCDPYHFRRRKRKSRQSSRCY